MSNGGEEDGTLYISVEKHPIDPHLALLFLPAMIWLVQASPQWHRNNLPLGQKQVRDIHSTPNSARPMPEPRKPEKSWAQFYLQRAYSLVGKWIYDRELTLCDVIESAGLRARREERFSDKASFASVS